MMLFDRRGASWTSRWMSFWGRAVDAEGSAKALRQCTKTEQKTTDDLADGRLRPKRASRILNGIFLHIYITNYEYIVHGETVQARITYEITRLGYCTQEAYI